MSMLDIFRIEYETKGLYTMIPWWDYVKQGLRKNMGIARDFYQKGVYHARSDHLLMSLIYALNIARNSTYERVYDNAYSRTVALTNLFRMTSATNRGTVIRNMFFGGNSKEVVFGHTSMISPRAIVDDWKNMKPVKVLRHPFTDTWANVPDGRPIVKDGISFFSVDIPMIATMYWCYQKEQDLVEAGGQPRGTPAQFVYAYLLANMMESMLDHSLFNRIYALQTGSGRNDSPKLHPFAVPSYDNELTNVQKIMLNRVQDLNRRISSRLDQVKLVFSDSALELSDLPGMAPTLQCFWALVAARTHMLTFALQSMDDPRRVDGTAVNLIQWSMNLQQTPRVIRNNLPIEAYVHVAPEIEYFMGL